MRHTKMLTSSIFLLIVAFTQNSNATQFDDDQSACGASLKTGAEAKYTKVEVFNLISSMIHNSATPANLRPTIETLRVDNFVLNSHLNTSVSAMNFKHAVILKPSLLTRFNFYYPIVMFDEKAVLLNLSPEKDVWVLAPIDTVIERTNGQLIYYVPGMAGAKFKGPSPVNPTEKVTVKFIEMLPGF